MQHFRATPPRYAGIAVATFLVAALTGCATVPNSPVASPAAAPIEAASASGAEERAPQAPEAPEAASAVETAAPAMAAVSVAAAPVPPPAATAANTTPRTPSRAPAKPVAQVAGNIEAKPAAPVATAPVPEPAPLAPPPPARNLWDRIRAGFALPELDTPLVAQKERFYLSKPEYLQRMMERGEPYLYYIVDEIEKRGMPTEIALLPFVESAMNPKALSSAKAAGLWQFIPSTGRSYNLSQNWWVDNRRDVVKSTQAALDYLQKIYEMHDNDWFLALASYNWGEGAVGRAVKRNQAKGLPAGYLDLKMPTETRHYVPKLIALKHLILHADEIGLALPDLPDRPYFAVIEKTRPIDLKLAAKFAGMSVDEFVALNPAHNRPVISATKNNQIKLPADRVDDFLAAIERHSDQNRIFATWQPHTLAANETLATVASRGGVSEPELRRANGLHARQRILPGTRILAPQKAVADESSVENFVAPRVYEQVSKAPLYYKVRKRDSLASIARRYRTSEATLASLNDLSKGIRSGMRLLVRRGGTQTMLTDENGKQRVVASTSAGKGKIRIASKKRRGASAGALISDKAPADQKQGTESSAANTREFAAKVRPVSLQPKAGLARRSPPT